MRIVELWNKEGAPSSIQLKWVFKISIYISLLLILKNGLGPQSPGFPKKLKKKWMNGSFRAEPLLFAWWLIQTEKMSIPFSKSQYLPMASFLNKLQCREFAKCWECVHKFLPRLERWHIRKLQRMDIEAIPPQRTWFGRGRWGSRALPEGEEYRFWEEQGWEISSTPNGELQHSSAEAKACSGLHWGSI